MNKQLLYETGGWLAKRDYFERFADDQKATISDL
jgi:hypothetical protein